MINPCKKVILTCIDNYDIKFGDVLTPNTVKGKCNIITVIPKPCYVSFETEFIHSRKLNVKIVELENNIAIYELDENGNEKNVYVYPKKTYNEFIKLYIEPIVNGEPPITSGALITGAPGIGKSTLAELVAKLYGIPHYKVLISQILSKWLGESEKNIENIFQMAIENPPMIVIFDDAENLLFPRELAEKSTSQADATLNIQNIMFQKLQEMYNKGVPSLIIATSNFKSSAIDMAFGRYGRFGDPIFIPLQDYEATFTVLKFIIKDEEKAKHYARKFVNAGLPISDVVNLGSRISKGLPAEIKPKSGRGYKRLYFDKVEEFDLFFIYRDNKFVEKEGYLPQGVITNNGRLYITTTGSSHDAYKVSEDVGVAIGTQLCYACGKSVIYLTDISDLSISSVKESVYTANITNSCFIVSSHVSKEIQNYIHKNLETTGIFVGKEQVYVPSYYLSIENLRLMFDNLLMREVKGKRVSGSVPIFKAVASMLGIDGEFKKYEDKIGSVVSSVPEIECVLNLVISTRTINDVVLSRAVSICKG